MSQPAPGAAQRTILIADRNRNVREYIRREMTAEG